jgi:hypothetical protein
MPSFLASPPPQDEYIPETKKPRLETPIAAAATTAADAATKTASPDFAMILHPPADVDDDEDTNTDSVTDTQSNPGLPGSSC